MNNTCDEYRELISCFMDEALSVQDASRLSQHLKECPECTAYLRFLGDMTAVIPAKLRQDPPPALHARVMDAIRTMPVPGTEPASEPGSDPVPAEAPKKKRRRLVPILGGLAAAACIAVVLFVYPGVMRKGAVPNAAYGMTLFTPAGMENSAKSATMSNAVEIGGMGGGDLSLSGVSGAAGSAQGYGDVRNEPAPGANSQESDGQRDAEVPNQNGTGAQAPDSVDNSAPEPAGGGTPSTGSAQETETGEQNSPAPDPAQNGNQGLPAQPSGGQADPGTQPAAENQSGEPAPGGEGSEPGEPGQTEPGTQAAEPEPDPEPEPQPAAPQGPQTEDPDVFDAWLTWHGEQPRSLRRLLQNYVPEVGADGATRYYMPTDDLLSLWNQSDVAYDIHVDPAVLAGDRLTGWSMVEVYPE